MVTKMSQKLTLPAASWQEAVPGTAPSTVGCQQTWGCCQWSAQTTPAHSPCLTRLTFCIKTYLFSVSQWQLLIWFQHPVNNTWWPSTHKWTPILKRLMCVTIPSHTAKLNPITNRTWGIPQQARKITVPNQATGTPVTLEPKPTSPSVKWFHSRTH